MGGDYVGLIVEEEGHIQENTSKNHTAEIEIMRGLLNVYITGFNTLNSYIYNADYEHAWMLLLTRTFRSLLGSFSLMQRGYYSESLVLLRTIAENWLVAKGCERSKDTLDILLTGKDSINRERFNFSQLAKDAEVKEIIYDKDYAYLSGYAHANRKSIAILLDQKRKELLPYPTYEELLSLLSFEMFCRSALLMIEVFGSLIIPKNDSLSSKEQRWARDSMESIRATKSYLAKLRSKYSSLENES